MPTSAPPEEELSQRVRPGFFSSARRFSLPLGPRIDPAGVGGYGIDLRTKCDQREFPPDWWPRPPHERPVDNARWGLGAYERHLAGEGDVWLENARSVGERLLETQQPDGSWVYHFDWPHTYRLRAPWISAMAQGQGASLLVRLHLALGDQRFAEAARRALAPMQVPTSRGGAAAELDGDLFPEEYPTDPPSFVLNGAIFALWGYRDVAVGLADGDSGRRFEAGLDRLAASIGRWDTGRWSRYDLFPHPVANLTSSFYHQLHIQQLEAMELLAPRPELTAARERFERYAGSRVDRAGAFGHKILFRLAVPRNRLLAHRLPWSR
jgi:heparosan-N-sulfate-glucuronate 5-epimerase